MYRCRNSFHCEYLKQGKCKYWHTHIDYNYMLIGLGVAPYTIEEWNKFITNEQIQWCLCNRIRCKYIHVHDVQACTYIEYTNMHNEYVYNLTFKQNLIITDEEYARNIITDNYKNDVAKLNNEHNKIQKLIKENIKLNEERIKIPCKLQLKHFNQQCNICLLYNNIVIVCEYTTNELGICESCCIEWLKYQQPKILSSYDVGCDCPVANHSNKHRININELLKLCEYDSMIHYELLKQAFQLQIKHNQLYSQTVCIEQQQKWEQDNVINRIITQCIELLNRKCPHCNTVYYDWSGCAVLHCSNELCKQSFCGICNKKSIDIYTHVKSCLEKLQSHMPAIQITDLYYIRTNDQQVVYKFISLRHVNRYLQSLKLDTETYKLITTKLQVFI